MAWRAQNQPHLKGSRTPTYYAGNLLWPQAAAPIDVPGRTSRRVHDNLVLLANYGLDVVAADIAASPYSSPYYINGRYGTENSTEQRGTSSSVQGAEVEYVLAQYITQSEELGEQQTTIELYQGKQIKFEMESTGRKVVGTRLKLKNTDGCTGVLSVYVSPTEDGAPILETAIDLCTISEHRFDEVELHTNRVVPANISPDKKLWVRMEIWDEVSGERSVNPFNTGRKIELAATGAGYHKEWEIELHDKNTPAAEKADWSGLLPNRPLIAFNYSDWEAVPVERIANEKEGATVTHKNRRYDIYCIKRVAGKEVSSSELDVHVIIYDRFSKKQRAGGGIKIDPRVERMCIAQVVDTEGQDWVYYSDGYSPLQRFRVGEWVSEAFEPGDAEKIKLEVNETTWFSTDQGKVSGSYRFDFDGTNWKFNKQTVTLSAYGLTLTGGSPATGSRIYITSTVSEGGQQTLDSSSYVDTRPVLAPSILFHHNNRLYLAGFRNDQNLVQFTEIDEDGPNYTSFPYRFYAPNRSPIANTLNPLVDVAEYSPDQLMLAGRNFATLVQTDAKTGSGIRGVEDAMPKQVSIPADGTGIEGPGDIVSYKGIIYTFSQTEGIRRFTGSVWSKIPNAIDTYLDRVDMTKRRKLWGHSNKLYFQYTDKLDGRRKAMVWDMDMNYQQYPWFQDVDTPFTDVRKGDGQDVYTIHPDYPVILKLYAEDCWRRLDSPIEFRRDTKYIFLPGNAADLILKRVHVTVLANATRWWWLSVGVDKPELKQTRNAGPWYRVPVWNTVADAGAVEDPFYDVPPTEKSASHRIDLMNLRIRATSFQLRVRAKTFRSQACLDAVGFEVAPRNNL